MKFLIEKVRGWTSKSGLPEAGVSTVAGRVRRWGALAVLLGAATAIAVPAGATCLNKLPLRGVNLAGAEFNGSKIPGTVFKDYMYPSATDITYFADLGANMIRLPFLWERLQPVAGGPLDQTQVKFIAKVIETAKSRNMCVLLDAHNYGAYKGIPLGKPGATTENFADFWVRMAAAFPDVDTVALGLMNEPVLTSLKQWGETSKATLAKLRENNAKHLVVIAGGTYSGAHDWATLRDGVSNASTFATLKDPLARSMIEVHQYVDSNYSGTKADCISPAKLNDILEKVKVWAVANKQRLFMGEFGVADTPECLPTLQAALTAMRGAPWSGWTYWSAGAWWGKTYIFNVQPITGVTRNSVSLLQAAWNNEDLDLNKILQKQQAVVK
ncbi:glycoside hydrolase family 5 protein [Janthinobacterium sp.]|uniref:glycoside hydrolase family 5 protein n=1 Tax=Janthinobacterium sp. TaxID=1871054 RepID=UPI002625302A|nr:glycoside hydrolase family 5 protein [Janthinobacterium sp.]